MSDTTHKEEPGAESATAPTQEEVIAAATAAMHAQPVEQRVILFNEELKPLLLKYNLGLMAEARITKDGRIVADPRLMDATDLVKSSEKALKADQVA